MAIVAIGLGAGAHPSAVYADSDYPALAGVTTVQTSTSGVATVRLTQAVSPSFKSQFGPGGSGVSGNGRITAIYLEQKGHVVAGYVHVRACMTEGCADPGFGFPWFGPKTINPGLYHLYVVADGAPITARLSLSGLPGTTSVDVAPDPDISIQSFTPLLPSTGVADPALYSANAGGTIGSHGGMVVNSSWIAAASYVAAYDDICVGPGAPPPAYATRCSVPSNPQDVVNQVVPYSTCDPTSFCDPGWTVDAALFGFGYGAVWSQTVPSSEAGTWTLGRVFQGAAVLSAEGGNGLWLSFAPDATTTTAPVAPSVVAPSSPSPSPSPTAAPVAPAAISLPDTASGGGSPVAPTILAAVLLALVVAVRRRGRRLATVEQPIP